MAQTGLGQTGPAAGKVRVVVAAVLIAIPIVLLAAAVVSWFHVGFDLPIADDWRVYLDRRVGSLDLAYLFTPRNDTLYPVGQVLDSIAHFTLGGNSVVYQALTMTLVLGSLLVMQWVLLRLAFGDLLHTAIPFSLCALMLLSGTYWGGPNIAYHQALPLVAIMASLVLALRLSEPRWWLVVLGFVLGLAAGLTYVSGAFGSLAAGGTMVFVGLAGRQSSRQRVIRVGTGLLVAGVITTVAQLWAVRALQGDDSMAGNPLTFPWEPDFWYYVGGKVGASLGLPPLRPRLAIGATVAAIAVAIVVVAWALRALRRRPAQPTRADVISVAVLTLAATITIYLLLIGAGRSSLRPSSGDSSPLEVFQFGFFRFHFFWVTLIWPWVGAAVLAMAMGIRRLHSSRLWVGVLAIAIVVPLVSLFVAGRMASGYDYAGFYDRWSAARQELYRCLLESVQTGNGHECVIWTPMNPASLILYARSIDASWAQYLQTVPVGPPTEPIFSLRDPGSGSVEFVDMEILAEDESGLALKAGTDAQIIIDVADDEAMRQCLTLEVQAGLRASEDDVAQLFFRRPDDPAFSPRRSTTAEIGGGDPEYTSVALTVSSDVGFADTIRFDPVFSPQEVDLQDLGDSVSLVCRLVVEPTDRVCASVYRPGTQLPRAPPGRDTLALVLDIGDGGPYETSCRTLEEDVNTDRGRCHQSEDS